MKWKKKKTVNKGRIEEQSSILCVLLEQCVIVRWQHERRHGRIANMSRCIARESFSLSRDSSPHSDIQSPTAINRWSHGWHTYMHMRDNHMQTCPVITSILSWSDRLGLRILLASSRNLKNPHINAETQMYPHNGKPQPKGETDWSMHMQPAVACTVREDR